MIRLLRHKHLKKYKTIFLSGGKRGLDIEVKPNDLENLLKAKIHKIIV